MEIDYKIYRIELKHTFGISRSKNEWYDILFLYIIDGAIIGRGEVAPSARYNETIQKIIPIIAVNKEYIVNFIPFLLSFISSFISETAKECIVLPIAKKRSDRTAKNKRLLK